MEIIKRFKIDGENAYILQQEDGNTFPVVERGLYDTTTLDELKASGYKILDYHGNILMPDGTNIKDLVEEECTISNIAKFNAVQLGDIALTEAEASVYFDREIEVSEIKTKEPVVEISTREELIKYLDVQNEIMSSKAIKRDIRPLNSFVAKEALFTYEEFLTSPNVATKYFRIIERRRTMNSFEEYERLVKFLQEQGVLGETYSANDIKDAYLSWGVCGLNAMITKSSVSIGTSVPILTKIENVAEKVDSVDETLEIGLLDKQGNVYWRDHECVNLNELKYDNFLGAPIKPTDRDAFEKLIGNTREWTTEYMPLSIKVLQLHNRTYFTMMSNDGITFNVKVDDNRMVIADSQHKIIATYNYLAIRGVDGVVSTLASCKSRDVYTIDCLARLKAADIVRANTRKCPVDSSYELFLEAGVGPKAALSYAGYVEEQAAKDAHEPAPNYNLAAKLYYELPGVGLFSDIKGFWSYVHKTYNPEDIVCKTADELIDVFIETRDRLIEEGAYLPSLGKKESGGFPDLDAEEDSNNRPVDVLEFARDIRYGLRNVGNFRQGRNADEDNEVIKTQNFIVTVLNLLNGYTDLANAEIVLSDIENTDIVDFRRIFRYRDAKYMGYIKDTLIVNGKRADECAYATMVTKIFREVSNRPIHEQRHYAMEVLSLPLAKNSDRGKRNRVVYTQLKEIIESAIEMYASNNIIDKSFKNAMITSAGSIAIKLAFGMFSGNVKPASLTLDSKVYNVAVTEGVNVTIQVPNEIVNHFSNQGNYAKDCIITLFDWCNVERTCDRFNFYCVNAQITPWEVKPLDGVKIPSYNWAVNFVFDTNIPGDLINEVNAHNAKIRTFSQTLPINNIPGADRGYLIDKYVNRSDDPVEAARELLENPDSVFDATPQNMSIYTKYLTYKEPSYCDVDVLNDEIVGDNKEEFPEVYTKRFFLNNKNSKGTGKYVRAIPLASDLYYAGDYEYFCNMPKCTEVEYADEVTGKERAGFLYNYQVETVSNENTADKLLAAAGNSLNVFTLSDQAFSDIISWNSYISGEWRPAAECIVRGKKITFISKRTGKSVTKEVSELSKEVLEQLVTKEMVYQLTSNKFLIVTSRGDYVLETY